MLVSGAERAIHCLLPAVEVAATSVRSSRIHSAGRSLRDHLADALHHRHRHRLSPDKLRFPVCLRLCPLLSAVLCLERRLE